MGNCQAVEAAAAVIQHPGGKVERIYWSTSASEVMGSNPGHYVAVIVAAPPQASCSRTAAPAQPQQRHLKLLRPDDTLHIGHVYRLVSFEEVLKEFASKKNVKLSRFLLKQQQRTETGSRGTEEERKKTKTRSGSSRDSATDATAAAEQQEHDDEVQHVVEEQSSGVGDVGITVDVGFGAGFMTRRHVGQWRPALQTIAEVGS